MILLSSAVSVVMTPYGTRAQDVTVPGSGTNTYDGSQSLTTSGAILVGRGAGVTGTVVIDNGGVVTMNTTDASTASRIELGNGGSGTLVVHQGGSLLFNMANSTPSEAGGASTSIGRIWVGGGPGNTTGGTGVLAMDGGTISFVPGVQGTTNYGGLAVGRGANVTGSVSQSGDSQVVFQSEGAIDLGTQGGHGTYSLADNAVLDASHGGVTMYVGSRTSTWTRAGTGGGTAATGEFDISGNARFTMTTGANAGGQLYVGDGGATGVINQSGNSVVTLNLANPISFGTNMNSDTAGGGTGTYNLQGGTLNVGNVGGSDRIVFGDSGTGIFNVSGGIATIATQLVLANQLNSHGTVDQTGGTVNLNGGLMFGSGTGTYDLYGGTLVLGGTVSGSGRFNFGAATLRVGGTPLISSSAGTLSGALTVDTNGSAATWSGALSGAGSLTKAGVGTLTLSGVNTYSGGTEIAGGTLALAGAGTIGSNTAALKVDANTVFDISASTAPVAIGSLSGSGTIKTGTNTFAVGVDNASTTFSGTIINNGVGWTGAFGAFAKVGTGVLTLDNATITGGESYIVGGSVVAAGTTSINYVAVGEGAGNTASLSIGNGASLTLGTGMQVGDFGGTGSVTQTGGLVTVTPLCGDLTDCASLNIGNMGGTGAYTITGGKLLLSSTAVVTIGRNAGSGARSTGTLEIDGGLVSLVNGASIVIGSRQQATNPGTGVINQTGGILSVDGASRLYLSGMGHGTYNLNGGTLQIGGSSLTGVYDFGAGGYQFNLGGGTIQVVGSNLTSTVNATLTPSTISHIDTNGLNASWSGVLSGTGGLEKQGLGTLILTGANTYTGGSTISAGTLQIGTGGTAGSIAGNVVNNGILAFNRSDAVTFSGAISGSGSVQQTGGTLMLSGNSSYSGGTTVGVGATLGLLSNTAAGTGAITLDDNATLSFANGLNVANALVVSGDNVQFSVAAGQTATESGALSGSGTYQITGGGTLNLTGNNSAFAGAMVLNGGTVNVDNSAAFGTGNLKIQGAVTLNYTVGGTQISNDIGITSGSVLTENVGAVGAVTQSGAITGDGGLVKSGTGVLVLTGNNSYAGGTTITGGTLQIGAGGTSGSIIGNATDNGTLAVDRSDAAVLSGTISGTGSVVQSGVGSLLLSGNNNYTGNTLLNAGTLIVGSNTALGSTASTLVMAEGTTLSFAGNFTVANNISVSGDPTFNVDAGQTGTVSGVISDGGTPGDIVKTGGGVLILTAANTYTAGTTISAGTLSLAGVGNIIGALVDNGTFDISAKTTDASLTNLSGSGQIVLGSRNLALTAATDTFGGVISGGGGITISGGREIFTGNNTYTGLTTIAATSTLQIGNGGTSGSLAGNVANSGTLVFNRSDTLTYAGVISGAGQIFQSGSGLVSLTGDSSSFAGTTTIQSGTLAVNGLLGGSIVVASGGTLAGTGTVAGVSVSGGTLGPGGNGSVGTLTVTGNLTFTSASTYFVDTNNSGNSDRVAVGGTATLNGATLRIGSTGNLSLSSRYTILTATGGVNGTFTASSNFAFLRTSLSYDANNVYLTFDLSASFTTVATTRNQFAVAGALDKVGSGVLFNAVVQLDMQTAQSAFQQLSGDVYPTTKAVLMDASHFVRGASVDRLRSVGGAVGTSAPLAVAYADGASSTACNDWCDTAAPAPDDRRLAFWTQAFGSWGQRNSDGNAAALSYSTSGFVIGADTRMLDNWRVGVLSGYSRTDLNPGSRSSTGTSDNYDVGLYGGAQWGQLGLRLGATYTWSDIATSRSIVFTGFNDSLSANYQAGTTQLFGDLGYRLDVGRTVIGTLSFEPFADLAFVNVHTNGFAERGGVAALSSSPGDDSLVFQTLGLRSSSTFRLGEMDLTAAQSVGWRHAYGDLLPTSTVAFAGGSSFVTAGAPMARDAAVIEAGFSTAASRSLVLSIFYSGTFSDQATSQGFRGNVTWKF